MSYSHHWPTFQQGYFYPNSSLPQQEPSHSTSQQAHHDAEEDDYTYYVRLIWSKKKTDFVVRLWHDEHSKFSSVADLKIKLMDAFPNDIPASANIQLGYFESPGNTKRWIMDKRDLQAMYTTFKPGSKMNLWCEKGKESFAENVPPPSQKKKKTKAVSDEDLEEEDDIFDELRSKNPKMAAPKLRLWAKMIKSGHHDSFEVPPPIPLITGSNSTKPKKESLADAFAGAASAIVKVLHEKPESPKVPPEKAENAEISPMEMASLRRGCLEDLKTVNELFQQGVFSKTEFEIEKQQILQALRKF